MKPAPVLIAVTDPIVHPEAVHIVAATGRPMIDSTDPREITRHAHRAAAVLVDATTAPHAATLPAGTRRFLLAAERGPIDWKLAMACHAEAAYVVPAQAPELLKSLGRDDDPPPAEGIVIAVMGAVGGTGTSTLASAIALNCENAVLIDADPSSGGVDLLLGIEESPGMRWNDLALRQGDVRSNDLIAAFPKTSQGLPVLTVARGNDAHTIDDATLNAVIRSLRGHTSVVVDLLRETSIADSALDAADCVVLCIPAEIRAVAAAERLVQQMRARNIKVVGVLRHRLWSSVDASDVERAAHLDVVAEIGNLSLLTKTTEYTGLSSPLPRSLKAAATAVLEEAQAA
ncbi:septum site-determining protein Ssd [Corynebacterium pseudotuberculosis]|uniref:septum site-determining protein Ssd n=1 Tax=Corynebacterium pseudotuberculosis TaxID=1719 RepID=UPI000676DD76|nr:septum site-determining protein Ssd [Corynebacterium pseudotuberculosis]AKS12567.1 Pilus assembly protein [Corynebacterium pseudotuberculosis]